MNELPLVSVCMITYNHESYIAQAIEGILMQKTDFQFELIIGEDFSTDKTRNICLDYERKFSGKICILQGKKNLGMIPNFIKTLDECRGKYIAICEGDDYWIDTEKLQKQVDFLESNHDFSMCFHKVEVKYENDEAKNYISNPYQKEISTFEDLAEGNFIHTLSCLFRNNLFDEFPAWLKTSPVGDYPLHLLNAQFGKIKFFDDVMGVYRINDGGIWESKSQISRSEKMFWVVKTCKNHFSPRGLEQFNTQLSKFATYLSNEYFKMFEEGDYEAYKKSYKNSVKFMTYISFRKFLALNIKYFLSCFYLLTGSYKSK